MNADLRATFKCPFCGQLCHAIVSEEAESGLIHELPVCDTFAELDPITFLSNCNDIFEQSASKPN